MNVLVNYMERKRFLMMFLMEFTKAIRSELLESMEPERQHY